MARSPVVGVTGPVDLVPVGIAQHQLSPDHEAPVRALAPVVRQPLEQGRRVEVPLVRLEGHRVAVEVHVATLDDLLVHEDGSFLLRRARHPLLLSVRF